MEEMEIPVLAEKIVGYLYFILGWSLIVQRKLWMDWIRDIEKNSLFFLLGGIVGLLFGLFIITVHNQWTWDLPVIVTVLGWMAALKGTLYLLAPNFMMKLIPSERVLSRYCFLGGGGMILLSCLILYGAYY